MARWLTVIEVADYLRCGERIVRDWMANDWIPHVIFAGKALFNTDRIDEWLLSMERGPLSGRTEKGPAMMVPTPHVDKKEMDVLPDYPKEEVAEVINELMTTYPNPKDKFVYRLGRNLKEDLKKDDPDAPGRDFLSWKVYSQLSRWCHPKRHSKREKWVQPRAEKISQLLFGKIIDRA